MKLMAPYTGGLLRLALLMIAIVGIISAAVGYMHYAATAARDVMSFDSVGTNEKEQE